MRTLSLTFVFVFLACLSETFAFPLNLSFLWRRAAEPNDAVAPRFERRTALNDTVVNGTSTITLYTTLTRYNSAKLYTTAVEVEDVTTTLTEQVTIYVTRTYEGATSTYVSPSVETVTQTLTYTRTVAEYLGTASVTSTATITATTTEPTSESGALFVSLSSDPASITSLPGVSTSLTAGTYTAESTITVDVTKTLTKTFTYTATVTNEADSTRYVTLTKTLVATETEAVVKPTSVKFVVDVFESVRTTSTLSTVASVGDDGDVTEIVTAVPATVTDLETTTSTLTKYLTIVRTQTVHRTTTSQLQTQYLNTTFSTLTPSSSVAATISSAPVTLTNDWTTLTTTSSVPNYSDTTTIFRYVTVDASNSSASETTSSAVNGTVHWRRHRERSRGLFARMFN